MSLLKPNDEILIRLNSLRDLTQKEKILQNLFPDNSTIPEITLPFYCFNGKNIKLGKNIQISAYCTIEDKAEIQIGDNCYLGPNVKLLTTSYEKNPHLKLIHKPIQIGNNVYISGKSIISPGVKIGHNVLIRHGSVVNQDIPDNSTISGNPCKIEYSKPTSD